MRLLRNFVVLFSGNVVGQLFFFFALARLARVLGPAEFGTWNFAQVLMLYLLRGSEFGLETVGIRETSRDPGTMRGWVGTVISLRFALGTMLFALACLIAWAGLLPEGTTTLVLISALAVFPMAFVLEWVFESRQQIGLISGARILKGVLFFLCVWLLVSSSQDTTLAAFLYLGSLCIPVALVAAVAMRRYGVDWSSLTWKRSLSALKMTGQIGTASMLSQYSMFASTVVVGYFMSREELGYFTAANRIVIFLWAYVILSMNRSLLPSLSIGFRESPDGFKQFVLKIFRYATLAAIPIGLAGTLYATDLMTLLYSNRYAASGVVFGILLWGFVLATIRSTLEIALISSDRQGRLMRGMVFVSVMYTILTPILTLQFGIVGAALAVLASEFSYLLYLVCSSPHVEPLALLRNWWKPAVAALAVMVPLLTVSGLDPFLRTGVGVVAFSVLIVAMKGVTRDDLQIIRLLIRGNRPERVT
jgi:O-antigen/teichoic acid export membrane protein